MTTAIDKLNSTTETISRKFLEALASWAYAWRNYGHSGHDKHGAYSQLQASWEHEFGEVLTGESSALELCRELAARGKGAFEV